MITPKFSCSQTDESLVTSIYCPSVRAADVELDVDDAVLTVHINPYFLRLSFPYPVVEDDNSSAQYDPSSGYLTVTLSKSVKGQYFPDLDLLAKLLSPRPSRPHARPSIEVLDSRQPLADAITGHLQAHRRTFSGRRVRARFVWEPISLRPSDVIPAAKNEWQLSQAISDPASEFRTSSQRYYGFLDAFTGYFTHAAHTENEINELGDDAEWDEEHYMFVRVMLLWLHDNGSYLTSTAEVVITEDEKMAMLRFAEERVFQEHSLYLTLITLTYAHAYDKRTTLNDPTTESAWTVCNLVAAFSALDPPPYSPTDFSGTTLDFTDAELISTLVTSYRRSLAFPLYRSFQLAERCRKDVAAAFRRGKRLITKYLLGLKDILDHHDVYYVIVKYGWRIFVCGSRQVQARIGEKLDALRVPKSAIGWDLEELEEATRFAVGRDGDSDDESVE
ncbi:SHQ1 protein-domain-containing protein [Pisolithus croceorrhizus]|nr:SHQ1 protein-domain-containing protein [Pisolithus croceorrhizus]